MTRFIVFANRKGGCGKTTTAVNAAHALSMRGKKVLLVDLDPQAHATISLGKGRGLDLHGIYDLLIGKADLSSTIIETGRDNLYLIPSSYELTAFEIDFSTKESCESIVFEKISQKITGFDYLIFDPPPTVGLLTISSLAAAKEVYIPMPMHFLAMEGLAEMMRLIYQVNAAWNSDLYMKGVIPTFFNKNTRIAKEITEDISNEFGDDRLFPGIRMNITLAEAPGHGKTILEYAPGSPGAKDYKALAKKIDLKE